MRRRYYYYYYREPTKIRRCSMEIKLFTRNNPVSADTTTTIRADHLIPKFYEAVAALENEDVADIIMAHKKNAKLWSYAEKYAAHNFMNFTVVIKELKPNIFTMFHTGGVIKDGPSNDPIETREYDYIYKKYKRAEVFDASGMFSRNYIITMNMHPRKVDNLMSYLVVKNKPAALRAHLERNESMETQRTNEPTPFQLACLRGSEEIVAMFIYYNVVPNLRAIQLDDETYYRHAPIYYASDDDNIVDMLIDYTFDKWSDFDLDVLFKLMFNNSPHLDRVLQILNEHSDTMTLSFASPWMPEELWKKLFTVRESTLKRGLAFLLKYRHTSDWLIEGFNKVVWYFWWHGENIRNETERKIFFENLCCLGELVCEDADEPKPTVLQMLMDKLQTPLYMVMKACTRRFVTYAEIEPFIWLLLSYNAALDGFTLDHILRFAMISGSSTLFDVCRSMDVDRTLNNWYCLYKDYKGPVASSYYQEFPLVRTITDVLSNPANINKFDIPFYVRMSSNSTVKKKIMELAESRPEMRTLLDTLPKVPTLMELAREAARKHVIEHYNIQTSCQFYGAVDQLPICEYHKKIIRYDVTLYKRSIRAAYPLN